MQETQDIQRLGFDPWVRKIPWRGHGNPLQCSCQENPMDRQSLVGYGPQGHKELDTLVEANLTRTQKDNGKD